MYAIRSYYDPEGKSPYGINDMSGNVWEWVDAYYLPHPGNTRPRPEYGEDKRVLKGGSWFDCLSYGCGLSDPRGRGEKTFFVRYVRGNPRYGKNDFHDNRDGTVTDRATIAPSSIDQTFMSHRQLLRSS